MAIFLTFRGTASTDEAHRAFSFSMAHYDEPVLGRIADCKKVPLAQGMIGIIKRRRKRIEKDCYRFIE
jgi:hypothetical protein